MIDLSDKPLPTLPARSSRSHKGDYGKALVVGGSLGMAGAPALAGMACLKSGAGLTTIATPGRVASTVAGYCPAYTTAPLADDGERLCGPWGGSLTRLWRWSDAVAVGPGLGQSRGINDLAGALWRVPRPMVIDADGLNSLAAFRLHAGENTGRDPSSADHQNSGTAGPAGPRVLTPHAGEFARLDGKPLADPYDAAERRERAGGLARALGGEQTVVLLKGPNTVIADGERFAVNATGNPGMATGGSGDVLTGVVAALLAQGLDAFDAGRLAAHVHGLAGDLAAAKIGQVSLTAVDLLASLPEAWRGVGDGTRSS